MTLHQLERNRRFVAANNAVFQHLARQEQTPDFVLMLNPDATVRTDVVQQLSAFLDGASDAGFAGPMLRQSATGALREAAFWFPNLGKVFQRDINFARLYSALPGWRIGFPSGDRPLWDD